MRKIKLIIFSLVLLAVILPFQNFDKLSGSKTLPFIIVNHDLYVHTLQPLIDGEGKALSPIGHSYEEVMSELSKAKRDITGNGAGFSLSLTYGSHSLWYWTGKLSYKEWLCRLLKGACKTLLSEERLDNLISGKVENRQILNDLEPGTIVSVRMNDHHHVNGAEKFLDGSFSSSEKLITRKIAAISPEFLIFLKRGFVVSKKERAKYGKFSDGPGCKEDGYSLDFSKIDVINHRYRQIRALLLNDNTEAVELDFSRSPCYFPERVSVSRRRYFMNLLLSRVFRDRNQIAKTGRHVKIIIRIPIDVEEHHFGISWTRLLKRKADAIILAKRLPYNSSDWKMPTAFRNNGDTKIYGEIYPISDAASTSTGVARRQAHLNELYTTAYEMRRAGVDGISLFNFQYYFKSNSGLMPADRFGWSDVLSCIKSIKCLEGKRGSYFLVNRNSKSDLNARVLRHSTYSRFTISRPSLRVSKRNRFFLRVQLRGTKYKREWSAQDLFVDVNGKEFRLIRTTRLPGIDPVYNFPNRMGGREFARSWKDVRTSRHRYIPVSALRNGTNKIRVYYKGRGRTMPIRLSVVLD
ncbi:hypothetical protein COB52_04240 [Candidatus Kaiserbacteria bacterium]|nr:MAG: hypothetical protein COB52_04240 [Candidatus Kaiserbacteria bacterium]